MVAGVEENGGPLTFCWNCLAERAAGPVVITYDFSRELYNEPGFSIFPACVVCGGSLTNVTPRFVEPEERWLR